MKRINHCNVYCSRIILHKPLLRLSLSLLLILIIFYNASAVNLINNIPNDKENTSVSSQNQQAESQQQKISGKVTDKSGTSLPGVSVLVKGTTNGTITDANGNYTLSNINGKATLQFSFVGMKTQEIAVTGQSNINVALEDESIGIEEVVAVGYGVQKKVTATGAIVNTTGETLRKSPTTNVSNTLVGKLAGVIAVNKSGEPGYDGATLLIRGANTLGNNAPLVVVDGIANRDLGVAPGDIESITVLKDASAAIYGAQAANGVILVTTKRGKTGKPSITVNLNNGYSQPTVVPEMTNSFEYATISNELYKYAGKQPIFSADDLQKFQDGSDPWGHPNTNFFKEAIKDWSSVTNQNISLSGGNESVKYFLSLGTRFQDGMYKNSASNFRQNDFRTNIDAKVNKDLDISFDVSGREEDRNSPAMGAYGIIGGLYTLKPTLRAYWPDGTAASGLTPSVGSGNPVVNVTDQRGYYKGVNYVLQSNLRLNIKIPWIKGLSIQGNASLDKGFSSGKSFNKPVYLYTWNGQPDHITTGAISGSNVISLSQSYGNSSKVTWNVVANYLRTIAEKHNIKLMIGTERQKGNGNSMSASRSNFISDQIDQLFAGANDQYKDNSGSGSQYARLNYFGRANYDFKQKYLFEFVSRYDGSYKFASGKQFGFFPGVSAGWRISEEQFWKDNIHLFDNVKLRGSIGRTGNDAISDYQYLNSFSFYNNSYVFGGQEAMVMQELRIPNPNVTWEVADQANGGVEMQLLKNKLSVSFDYFHNKRSQILWQRNASVPAMTGLTLPPENIGKVENKGYEFVISYNDQSKALKYNVSLNGSYSANKILFWDEAHGAPDYQQSTGYPMGAGMYYQAMGIYKDQAAVDASPHISGARPGDIIFQDYNNDGKINDLDKVRDKRSNIPKFIGGLNINLEYKRFDLAVLFQGAAGGVTYLQQESGTWANFLKEDYDGRWTEQNPDAQKPRAFNWNIDYFTNRANTYSLKSNDYLRIKNLELGYNMPDKINKVLGVNRLRIYVNGTNLLTFSKIKRTDPEMNASRAFDYFIQRVFNTGLVVTF